MVDRRILIATLAAALTVPALASRGGAQTPPTPPSPPPSASPAPTPAASSAPSTAAQTAKARAEFDAWQSGSINLDHYIAKAREMFTPDTVKQISETYLKPIGAGIASSARTGRSTN